MFVLGAIASFFSFVLLMLLPLAWNEPWMREPLFTRRDR